MFKILKFKIPFLITSTTLIVLCCSTENKYTGNDLLFFEHLVGTWKMEGEMVFESWSKSNGIFQSSVFEVSGNDTVITEKIRLISLQGEMFYEATVANQNQGKPVLFKLTEITKNEAVFKNELHDFPQLIVYEFLNANNLKTTISGMGKDENKAFDFLFQRIGERGNIE